MSSIHNSKNSSYSSTNMAITLIGYAFHFLKLIRNYCFHRVQIHMDVYLPNSCFLKLLTFPSSPPFLLANSFQLKRRISIITTVCSYTMCSIFQVLNLTGFSFCDFVCGYIAISETLMHPI